MRQRRMITVTPHPRDWCAECGQSWGRDDIAVTVAGVTICDKCAARVADVARTERERRRSERRE